LGEDEADPNAARAMNAAAAAATPIRRPSNSTIVDTAAGAVEMQYREGDFLQNRTHWLGVGTSFLSIYKAYYASLAWAAHEITPFVFGSRKVTDYVFVGFS